MLCPKIVFIDVPQTFYINLSSLDVIDSHTNTREYKYIFNFPKHFLKDIKIDDLCSFICVRKIQHCKWHTSSVNAVGAGHKPACGYSHHRG